MLTALQELMVKTTLVRISVLLLISFNASALEVRKLHFNFNKNVTIWITNQPCTYKPFAKMFPWHAEAIRSDGEILKGCFNGENNTVTIQWIGGDQSKFPADSFLANKDKDLPL